MGVTKVKAIFTPVQLWRSNGKNKLENIQSLAAFLLILLQWKVSS